MLSVYDSIILRDVVQRLGIKDVSLFNLLLEYIMDTMGREFSAENIIKFLKSEKREISTETLYNYLDALCNALIIRKINRYDVHGKMVLKTLSKYYMTDLGIGSIKHNNPNFDGEPVTKIEAGETGDKTFYAKWTLPDEYYIRSTIYAIENNLGEIRKIE